MKCRKDLVLSSFRVQYVDLREPPSVGSPRLFSSVAAENRP